jgi:hypothetical protein
MGDAFSREAPARKVQQFDPPVDDAFILPIGEVVRRVFDREITNTRGYAVLYVPVSRREELSRHLRNVYTGRYECTDVTLRIAIGDTVLEVSMVCAIVNVHPGLHVHRYNLGRWDPLSVERADEIASDQLSAGLGYMCVGVDRSDVATSVANHFQSRGCHVSTYGRCRLIVFDGAWLASKRNASKFSVPCSCVFYAHAS